MTSLRTIRWITIIFMNFLLILLLNKYTERSLKSRNRTLSETSFFNFEKKRFENFILPKLISFELFLQIENRFSQKIEHSFSCAYISCDHLHTSKYKFSYFLDLNWMKMWPKLILETSMQKKMFNMLVQWDQWNKILNIRSKGKCPFCFCKNLIDFYEQIFAYRKILHPLQI